MKKRLVTSLLLMAALCLALVGCGGGSGSGSQSKSDPKEKFVGLWEISGMTEGGEEYSESNIGEMKEFGLVVYIELDEDGDASFEFFGEVLEGEWEAKSSTRATMTIDDNPIDLRLKGSKLVMEQGNDTLSFAKIDPEDRIEATSLDEFGELLAEGLGGALTGELESDLGSELGAITGSDSEEQTIPMSQVLVDDDIVKIEITGKKQDWLGYVGYSLRVENKSDKDFSVSVDYGSCSVDGKMCDPLLHESIRASKYAEVDMLWDSDDVSSLDKLVEVEGTIKLYDADYNDVATYDFKVD